MKRLIIKLLSLLFILVLVSFAIPYSACSDEIITVNFNVYPIEPRDPGNQDINLRYTIEDNGSTVHFVGNGVKKVTLPRRINGLTILELDFKCLFQGEIHAIGYDYNDDTSDDPYIFQLYGTQDDWGFQTYKNYSGMDWKHYTIHLACNTPEPSSYLILTNDQDVDYALAESLFSNIVLYDLEITDSKLETYENSQESMFVTFSREVVTSTVVVSYTISGTGTENVDYTASGDLTFNHLESSSTLTFTPIDDNRIEADETIIVNIGDVSTVFSIKEDFVTSPVSNTVNEKKVVVLCGDDGYLDLAKDDEALIVMNPLKTGSVSLKIYDLTGYLLWSHGVSCVAGERKLVIWEPSEEVLSGIYIVQIKGGGLNEKNKIAVIR